MDYGNIVLADTKSGFIVNAIKWFTKSQFSHSFVTMPDILGVPMCIEAAASGVDMTRFDNSYQNNIGEGYQVWQLNLPQDVKDTALKQMLNDLEIGYGHFQYPWFIWRKVNLLFGRDIKKHNNWNTSGMICSQLCVAYLKACGVGYIFEEYGDGSISPQDLQDIFKVYPGLFTLIESCRL